VASEYEETPSGAFKHLEDAGAIEQSGVGQTKARAPQVSSGDVPKHWVRCRSCTSEPAIPCVVTRDSAVLYIGGAHTANSTADLFKQLQPFLGADNCR